MEYRILGKTNFKVSEVGLGSWAFGGAVKVKGKVLGWGEVDDNLCIRIIHRAMELGVNFIDTSDAYGVEGKSEKIIGRALKSRPDKCYVATKVGKIRTPDIFKDDFFEQYIFEAVEKSLTRLQTDVIDLYLLHNPSLKNIKEGSVFETLEKLKKNGKIRFYGVSIDKAEEGIEAIERSGSDVIEVRYNILDQEAAQRLFSLAAKKKIGIIARESLRFGLLTGKWTEKTTFPMDDWRGDYYKGAFLKEGLEKVEKLRFLVKGNIKTMARAAIKFSLSDKRVSVVIVGARNERQLGENTACSGSLLPKKDLDKIKDLYDHNFYLDKGEPKRDSTITYQKLLDEMKGK